MRIYIESIKERKGKSKEVIEITVRAVQVRHSERT